MHNIVASICNKGRTDSYHSHATLFQTHTPRDNEYINKIKFKIDKQQNNIKLYECVS